MLALAFAAQIAAPALVPQFERDAAAIARGEYYRLFTALWFQDGGLVGAAFNLTILLIVGSLAEMLWTRRGWLVLYFGPGLAIETLALRWQPVGAGNSIACFGLAGGLLVKSGVPERPLLLRAAQAIGLCAGIVLAWNRDIHGAALLLGAVLGLLLSRLRGFRAVRAEAA